MVRGYSWFTRPGRPGHACNCWCCIHIHKPIKVCLGSVCTVAASPGMLRDTSGTLIEESYLGVRLANVVVTIALKLPPESTLHRGVVFKVAQPPWKRGSQDHPPAELKSHAGVGVTLLLALVSVQTLEHMQHGTAQLPHNTTAAPNFHQNSEMMASCNKRRGEFEMCGAGSGISHTAGGGCRCKGKQTHLSTKRLWMTDEGLLFVSCLIRAGQEPCRR